MAKIYPAGIAHIDGNWTCLPKNVIIRLIYEEYGLTFEEWQKQGLPFPEERKKEYLELVDKNGGKPLP